MRVLCARALVNRIAGFVSTSMIVPRLRVTLRNRYLKSLGSFSFAKTSENKIALVLAFSALLVASQGAFAAASFDSRLAKAHASLQNGDPDGAMATYRELQTEDPESEVLYYSMGCAEYKQGEKLIEQKAPRDAVESFKAAKASLEKVQNARDPDVRKNAQYNHANATAQIAMNSANAQQYEESKTAFEESVKEYEAFLKQYPEHEGARRNLEHVRYLLKSMLQNPPPPQQQQGQNDKKQEQNKDQKQEQQKQEQQGQEQDKQEQDKKEQEKQEQQKQDKQDEQKKQEQEQAGAEAKSDKQDDKEKQEKAQEEPQPESQQNVEAILQTLEDTDKKEQKDTKNVRTEIRTSKDWW